MDSASDSSTACLVELGSVYFGSPGGGDGGGDGGELQVYVFATKPAAPSAATFGHASYDSLSLRHFPAYVSK